jgi:sterol desaturase/sphingolipid hydroxylase (fatty acid hydroxylase superfamily)
MLQTLTEYLFALITSGQSYLFLLPIYFLLLSGERLAHAFIRPKEPWSNRESLANIAITGFTMGLNFIVGHLLPLGLFALLFEHLSLLTIDLSLTGWLTVFLLYDLAWYVDHRIAHRTGFLWAFHHVHHSCPDYNMTVASRGLVLDITLLTRPTFYLLPLLGVSPLHFMVMLVVTNIWGIAQHTRLVGRLPWLDELIATPSNHRVHHGSEPKYLDRNYGETLMVWDRLFGTYQAEEQEPTYGVTEPINTSNPLRIQVAGILWLRHKMSKTPYVRQKLACLVMPPEWLPRTPLIHR